MKTKTKQIKCWANYYPNRDAKIGSKMHIHEDKREAEEKCLEYGITVPCTIILELPVEEKKVTISESELAEAWDKMSHHTCYALSKESVAFDIFKQKIFGGGCGK